MRKEIVLIRIIEGLPENVVAVEAVGKVTAEDYESVLMPAIESAKTEEQKVKMLMVFGPEFEGYEAEAALDDLKMGLHEWGDFDRIAFVSDKAGYRALVKGMGFLMPGEVQVFGMEDLDAAREWISGIPAV